MGENLMAKAQRWLRIDTGIFDSEWVFLLPPLAQLAWIRLLVYVKAEGTNGEAKALSLAVASKKWSIPQGDIQAMLEAARADGALADKDDWVVVNWQKFQQSPSTLRVRKHRALQSADVTPQSVTECYGALQGVPERFPCHATETETETETSITLFASANNGAQLDSPSSERPMSEPFGAVYRVLEAVDGREVPESKVRRYLGKGSPVLGLLQQYGETDAIRLIQWAAKHKRLGVAAIFSNSGVLWHEAEECEWGSPRLHKARPSADERMAKINEGLGL